ncbi:MAG: carbohydrate kinase [Anaerolineales bacterium]
MDGATRVIVGLGEILWDIFPGGKQLGGAPANFVYHVRELGGGGTQPLLVSCVGPDESGREALARWDALSLSRAFIAVDAEHPTGAVTVALDPRGMPVYDIARNAAWDFLPESPPWMELAAAADAVCFGTLAQRSPQSRKTISNFLHHTKTDCLRILDINLRDPFFSREVVDESLSMAGVLKTNSDEFRVLADYFSIAGGESAVAAGLMRRWKLRLVALTRGEKGSTLYTPNASSTHDGFPVASVDTVGAGDAFSAAVAVGMLGGYPLDRISACANRAASYVCTRPGAMPEMPDEVKKLFR